MDGKRGVRMPPRTLTRRVAESLAGTLAGVLVVLLPLSCATVQESPAAASAADYTFAFLGGDAALYLRLDAAASRPLLEETAKLLDLKDLGKDPLRTLGRTLDRTESVAIAAYAAGSPRRFALVAAGDYPSPWTGLSLTLSRGWKRARDEEGRRFWRSSRGYSIALGRSGGAATRLAFVSDGPPLTAFVPPVRPRAVDERFQAAAAYGWVPVTEALLSALPLSGLRLPVRELSFAMEEEDGLYRLTLVASAGSAREARAVSAILNLARTLGALPSAADTDGGDPVLELLGMLAEDSPSLEGADLVFRSRGRSAEYLALLCARFSVYFTDSPSR
jgi:hypothetical protein